jgi:integrase/recombinase XerD
MANLKYVLRTNKVRDDGTCPIFLRITAYRQVGYISTKIYIKPEQWDKDKQRVKRNNASCGEYNKRLTDIYNKVYRVSDDDKTVGEIQTASHGNGKNDFVEYAEGVIESVYKRGQYWNSKNMSAALKKLIDFHKKKYRSSGTITFKEINPEYIRKFGDHLVEIKNKKNTIAKSMGSLKRIFNIAADEGKIEHDKNPFRNIKLQKERSNKQKLSVEDIRKIEELELPAGSLIWHVRNYFMYSFYTGGTRFIDVCYLKWKHIENGRMIYRMSKTSAESNIKLLPPALEILEYYKPETPDPERFIFPLLPHNIESEEIGVQKKKISSLNALVNKYLGKIQQRAGVETHISFHIARHSFADDWRRSGGSIHTLQGLLRHSSLSITAQYLKSFDVETHDAEMETWYSTKKPDKEKTLKLVR